MAVISSLLPITINELLAAISQGPPQLHIFLLFYCVKCIQYADPYEYKGWGGPGGRKGEGGTSYYITGPKTQLDVNYVRPIHFSTPKSQSPANLYGICIFLCVDLSENACK